ncbi:hypothetical protein Sjap_014103 [Stephania japonica]|uniref:Phosphoinositide phospholipase C n=1 Tax=Stephania japonica TaxID=461633 RepID=A0AAP0J1Q7_9MAGN
MSKQTYRVCFCFHRKFKQASSEVPGEIKALFERYSENGTMSADQLQRFLVECQGETKASLEDAHAIVDKFKHINFFQHNKGLNLDAFFRYLFGDCNSPLSPSLGVHQDMTAPLSHYFIYTGHNSYLTGNQLSSDCSEVPIMNALKRGVRVIELDMWPNSAKDNVNVLHGRTLTTPVELIKCLRSIKEHAFFASPYPVVVTLEDHLTSDLQAKVAEMITDTFGDILFTPGSEALKEFPSPESLKHRIIISTKPPKEYLESKSVKGKENDGQKGNAAEDEAWGKEVPDFKPELEANNKQNDPDGGENSQDEEDLDAGDRASQKIEAPEYKRLIAIHAGKPKGGLDEALKVDSEKVRRLSMSEPQLEKAARTHGTQIVRFTQRNILRVYPKGTRFDSSNYNPLIGWMHGAQMVAFNMQVKVFSGEGWHLDFKNTHFDMYSPPDFYVRLGIAGVPADSMMKKTKAIEDSWIPSWGEEFEFPLSVPELALVRIEVHEYDMSEKDDFGGQTCFPVSELRSGIRSVPLHDQKGDKYDNVRLLMRFEVLNIENKIH